MAFDDIGYMLFVQVLGMTEYPGQPFTGIIVRDLILFLLVPTIFIIFVVYILLGRLAVQARKIRLLLGLGIYLFILAGGYYRVFALLAGPYFIVLIFILGVLYFIPTHFRVQGGGMPGRSVGGHGYSEEAFASMSRSQLEEARVRTTSMIRNLDNEIREARKQTGDEREDARLSDLRMERVRLKARLDDIDEQLQIVSSRKVRKRMGL